MSTVEPGTVDILAGEIVHELLRHGVPNDRNMLSASALVSPAHHRHIVQAHEAYMKSGATMIVTSNYYVTPGVGFTPDEIRTYSQTAGELAVEARKRCNGKDHVKICGTLPPLMHSFRSDRTIERQKGLAMYLLIGEALLPSVDLLLAETMSSLAEAKLAFEGVQPLQKPVMVSFALNSTGQLRSGEDVLESVRCLIEFCTRRIELLPGEGEGNNNLLCGILFNCSQPEDMSNAFKQINSDPKIIDALKEHNIRIGGYGDHISSLSKAGAMEESLVPGALQSTVDLLVYTKFAMRWIEDGASIVGGCCNIPPNYLQNISETLKK
ncbi:homocysteine s-methyltransferase [Plasmopara halstedii]|uniref:Homocysteine s-methyltransferase n=1 Tax=Plasmopara halstedii TaxID=4781 RepID=A0A0P1AXI2_PLAHL|nr:homocysteine s-methyltransferase [Plasmopara halstedii]CEG47166.1 homocysteine s-methyltransferase [Plasmopara halstedii]|eukprot:XP_024583535.1 homocysteine s-methyltransferase [Plasmopara halstedii]